MATAAAILGAGALAAGGSVLAARESADAAEDIAQQAQDAPPRAFEQSIVQDLFTGQQAILLGASPDQVAENFILTRANRNVGPDAARSIAGQLDSIRATLLEIETLPEGHNKRVRVQQVESALDNLNSQFVSSGVGIPVRASIENGEVIFNFADEGINRFIQESRLLGPNIRQQRLSGIEKFNQLIGAPSFATPENFERFRGLTQERLLAELVDREGQVREQLLQTSNVNRLNPAAGLSRLGEAGVVARAGIEDQSINRALSLVTSLQETRAREGSILEGLLFPQSSTQLIGLENQQLATTNQLAAAQLSASTQAGLAGAAARGSGIQGAFQSGADALTLVGLLRAAGGPAGGPSGPALPAAIP